MKFIYRNNIDVQKWDALVKSQEDASVFSLSTYLDAVSENWCVLVDENYSKGIAVPYIVRLGVKVCYTPIFVRYLEFFGVMPYNGDTLIDQLKSEFKQGQLNLDLVNEIKESDELVFQKIAFNDDNNLNSQAKRMLTKFEKSGMKSSFSKSTKNILDRIDLELPQKISALNPKTLGNLEKLVDALKKKDLVSTIEVKENDQVVGGLILVEFNGKLLYLKGAFSPEAKKEGAMYAAMQGAILHAKEKRLNFDFGGSRVEGVRRFNVNLGAKDQFYSSINWDNAPIWYKLLKKINQAWKKK